MEGAARLLAEHRPGVSLPDPTTTNEGGMTMGVPPEHMAALQGGPPDTAAPRGGPPDPTAGRVDVPANAAITSRDEGSDLDHIRTAILALQAYAEGIHDDVELAAVHKCITALQNILAGHSKNKDAAMGTTPAMKHIRRTSRGAGY
jgi:hypothetical protein